MTGISTDTRYVPKGERLTEAEAIEVLFIILNSRGSKSITFQQLWSVACNYIKFTEHDLTPSKGRGEHNWHTPFRNIGSKTHLRPGNPIFDGLLIKIPKSLGGGYRLAKK